FITRHVYAEVPPRVEYSLTDRARSFMPLVEDMIVWAQNNMAGILKDRSKARA
ncbi:MAG TPA: transcriptional regulator, partial [Prevotella sp.]|nr:transcriptional regulator [Prevotella sp.]